MTSLTLITLLVVAYGVLGSGGYARALALGGATAAGSAIFLAGIAVPTFYAVAMGAVIALILRMLGTGQSPAPERQPLPPGASLLILFAVWSTVVTVTAPLIFNGMAIVTPQTPFLVAGVLTSSNLAQLVYLVLGVCVVVFLARSPSARPEVIALAAGTATLLSLWRYLSQNFGLPFPEGLFDNSPSFAYIETAPGGLERFRGIFSEPAGLAGSSLVTIAYMLPRARDLRGWHRAGAIAVAAVALQLGIISTSTTFIVAGLALTGIAAVTAILGFISRRTSLRRSVSIGGCIAVIIGLWVLPIVTSFVDSTVNSKLASPSYGERSSANTASIGVFLDTFGFGVGPGSARASSFVPTLLSATGLPGTLLFVAAIATLVHRAWAVRIYRPVVWALVALLVAKITAGPDLSDSTGILWISLGLLSHAVLGARTAGSAELPEARGRPIVEVPRGPGP